MEKHLRLITSSDSKLLCYSYTRVLHKYDNGEVLIEIPQDKLDEDITERTILNGLNIGIQPGIIQEIDLPENNIENLQREKDITAYVKLIGPTENQWLKQIQALQVEIIRYQPNYSYLCRGKVKDILKVAELSYVDRICPNNRSLKFTIATESGSKDVMIIYLTSLENFANVKTQLCNLQGVEIISDEVETINRYLRIRARVTSTGENFLLNDPNVLGVEEYSPLKPEGEVANLILSGNYSGNQINGRYLDWLNQRGLSGVGVSVGIVDAGVDVNHEAFSNRIIDLAHGRKDWHGTMVAGHVAGFYLDEKDQNGFIYGIGVAPKAELLSISNQNAHTQPQRVVQQAIQNTSPSGYKTKIMNNSWGAGTKPIMDYGTLEAAYDALVRNANPNGSIPEPMIICFSAGNSGVQGLTRPKAAKNIIVTGNSESINADGGQFSNNIHDVYQNNDWQPSSHGNCGDQRIRPDVVAPGEFTTAPNFGIDSSYANYISDKIVYGGGTSGASPKTAGVAALIVQWWRKRNLGDYPSPAMVKALLINTAIPMRSGISRPPVPSMIQGWGRVSLNNIIDVETNRFYIDQKIILRRYGDQWKHQFTISNPSQPLKITLSWTDPPASINTGDSLQNSTIVNRLSLKLEIDQQIYYGNNFEHGWSKQGAFNIPIKEGSDNTQNIFIPEHRIQGEFTITVEALNITTNCFNFEAIDPQQDFALVVDNASPKEDIAPHDIIIGVDDVSDEQDDNSVDGYTVDDDQTEDLDYLDQEEIVTYDDDQTNSGEKHSDDFEDNSFWYNDPFFSSESEHPQRKNRDEIPATIADEIDLSLQFLNTPKGATIEGGLGPTIILKPSHPNDEGALQTITQLIKRWKQGVESKIAIFVVGKKSTFTKKLLANYQQLAVLGKIHFISTYPSTLCFLASKIQTPEQVQYRLATSQANIGSLIKSIIANHSGYLQAILDQKTEAGDYGIFKNRFDFDVIQEDEEILIQIPSKGDSLEQLLLKPPGQERNPILLNASQPKEDILINKKENRVDIKIKLQELGITYHGIWKIFHSGSVQIQPTVWCKSRLNFWVHAKCLVKDVQKLEGLRYLIKIEPSNHAKLHLATISALNLSKTKGTTKENTIRHSAKPKKWMPFDSAEIRHESGIDRKRAVCSLEQVIITDRKEGQPTLIELSIHLEGMNCKGSPFKRVLHKNIFAPIPYSELRVLRRRNFSQGKYILCKVTKVFRNENNVVTALRLKSRLGERAFQVLDPKLRKSFSEMELSQKRLHFKINKGKIYHAVLLIDEENISINGLISQ